MKKIDNIVNKLDTELESLESSSLDILTKAEKGINASKKSLNLIRDNIVKYSFKTLNEEIHFFKWSL